MGLMHVKILRLLCGLALIAGLSLTGARADSANPPPPDAKAAPATPETKAPPSATPPAPAATPVTPSSKAPPATPATPDAKQPDAKEPGAKPPAPAAPLKEPSDGEAPAGKPGNTEIEPHGSPGIPQNATTESVNVPARPVVMVAGKSSYDEAFKSIKASQETVKAALSKAGLKPAGHPITIFSEPDDKGFKYQAAIPLAAKPDGKPDFGPDVKLGESPSGKAIKFQHRGAYEDIDSTYDVITAYLDAKGLQVDNPYIEEYLTDLTTPDDPNLQVDIYVFVKP